MNQSYKNRRLTQAVLASSFFMLPLAAQATDINAVVAAQSTAVDAAADGILHVTTPGKISTGAADAVTINGWGANNGGQLIVEANNDNGANAVQQTGKANNGVVFTNVTGAGGSVVVKGNSGITGTAGSGALDAIQVNALNTAITNSGAIVSDVQSSVHITGTGQSTITNNIGGFMQGSNPAALTKAIILIDAGAAAPSTIVNAGLINQNSTNVGFPDAIKVGSTFTSLSNVHNGIIVVGDAANTGHVINLDAGVAGGTISNAAGGRISNNGLGSAINLAGGAALSAGGINNAGLIISTKGSNIVYGANSKGDLTNSGTIANNTAGNDAIDFSAAGTASLFTQNAGIVTGNVVLAQTAAGGGNTVLQMNGGTIAGNVTANALGTPTLNLAGGSITGAVTTNAKAGNIVNLSGTTVYYLSGNAAASTFNITGGSFGILDGLVGGATVNINNTFTANGSFLATGGALTLNVNGAADGGVNGAVFRSNGPITNIVTLTVKNGATWNPYNETSTNVGGTVSVNAGGTLLVDSNAQGGPLLDLTNGGGVVTNNGTVSITHSGILNVHGPQGLGAGVPNLFTNAAGGVLNTGILGLITPGGTASNGDLIVNNDPVVGNTSVNLVANSFLQPTFGGFLPLGSTFDVIHANGTNATITNAASTLQPASAVISFTPSVVAVANIGQVLRLTTNRNAYASLATSAAARGAAGVLDSFVTSNAPASAGFSQLLLDVLINLDQNPTAAQVQSDIESLVPPFNSGLPRASQAAMEMLFNEVGSRLSSLRMQQHNQRASNESALRVASNESGMSFGDAAHGGSVWVGLLGQYANQNERNGVEGYKAKSGGLGIGADFGVNECFTFGLAGSYTKTNVDDKHIYPKDDAIKSWQGTAYGWLDFNKGLFLDVMLGVAHEDIDQNRIIHVGTGLFTAAQASYDGTMWGGRADLGWKAWTEGACYFAPFARLEYTHLDLDGYTESGAGDLNLTVNSNDLHEFLGGIGFRFGTASQAGEVVWKPELTALLAYDFDSTEQNSVAHFAGGGAAFSTNGIRAGRTIFDLGLGLGAQVAQNSLFTVKYNLELRSDYVSNGGYIQYNYLWS